MTLQAVTTMVDRFGCNPADIRAGIGPCIGVCCYGIGQDVIDQVNTRFGSGAPLLLPQYAGKSHFDLAAANDVLLQSCGIPAAHIEHADACTACNSDIWFSHRAERGTTGRFISVIGLRQ